MPETPLRADRERERSGPRNPSEWYPYQRQSTDLLTLPPPEFQLSSGTVRLVQLSIVVGILVLGALAYGLHDGLRAEIGRALAILATGDGLAIGAYLRSFGVWAPVASLFLMLIQAVAAPIPAILVAFANGLTFGVFWGGLLTVAGQTLAAIVCFGISRALGRGPVEALSGRLGLESADRWLARWGARGIVLLRLVPGISFDVVSYGAGLTGIGWRPFVAATAIGVAPQAFLYAYLIREAPQTGWIFYAVSWGAVAVIGLAAIGRSKWQNSRSPTRRGSLAHDAPSSLPTPCPSGAD